MDSTFEGAANSSENTNTKSDLENLKPEQKLKSESAGKNLNTSETMREKHRWKKISSQRDQEVTMDQNVSHSSAI